MFPLGTKDKTAATPGQPMCPPTPEQKWDGGGLWDDSDDRWGVLALPGAAACLWCCFSCSLIVAAMVMLVMGVSLPMEFSGTLLDCFLAQLISIGTVAPCPCHTGMWGNDPMATVKLCPQPRWSWLQYHTPAAAPLPLLSPLSCKNISEGWEVREKQWLGMGCHVLRSLP